ncbi:MAG: MFS transporter [Burkholderiales bacterium]|nr:MFS transporter [Burkholderiales bacterium]MDE1926001.1 MFS transporter [Burkholderiales bacterium]MDE2160228.1 MFS transporter [Burkholderiales bacterium]
MRALFQLAPGDLLRDPSYRRLWSSILTSSFGNQVMLLALPLTAAVLLHATPVQMGKLTAVELLPFLIFSLPSGVWLDRVRKLPVYVVGESTIALVAASVPLAWWLGWLAMGWLYAAAFVIGAVNTVAGSAAQVVLTQVVARERLVEAHAKNALATSGAEVAGPGVAGALIRVFGAPLALLVNAVLLFGSAAILRNIRVHERRDHRPDAHFWRDLRHGLRFVAGQRLLLTLALLMAIWQMCNYAATTVQILIATRTLGLSEQQVGLCYMGMGVGTISGSLLGRRVSLRIGPGPCLVLGYAISAAGWLLVAVAPANRWGVAAFSVMLMAFSMGAVFIFINFLALRQAVTPEPLLGRMTSTMRWLSLLAASPGALIGGWLGQHAGLRWALAFAGGVSALLALVAWRLPLMRELKGLPAPETEAQWLGVEAGPGYLPEGEAGT